VVSRYAHESYEDVSRKIRDLFPNMRVITQLYELLRDPESSLDDAIELIRSDGVIATGVVRLSNSAAYGSPGESLDLQGAVQKVGFGETLRLVGGILSRQLFMRDLPGYGMTADEYWNYSYYCAAFMEETAPIIGMHRDIAYLSGLLHGIGRLVNNEILNLSGEVEIYWDATVAGEEWEKAMGLKSYMLSGADLLRSWNFPEALCEVIENQRNPEFLNTSRAAVVLDYARSQVEANRPAIGPVKQPWRILEDHRIFTGTKLNLDQITAVHEKTVDRIAHLQHAL